jgi:diaminopimelate decarboxylase
VSRLDLFPVTTRTAVKDGKSLLTIAGLSLSDLADQYGTPLYIYDEATLADAVETYRRALRVYYPGEAGLTYAGKAFLCIAMAKWAAQQGLRLDCSGVGELFIAACADVPKGQVVVHGVNKTHADLEAALEQGGVIVVDNFDEIQRLAILARDLSGGGALKYPKIWLRVRPGQAVRTHAYTQTGQEESKFGFSPEEARQAVRICLEQRLPIEGLHFHLGSHFHDPTPLEAAIDTVLKLAANLRDEIGWVPRVLSPGGGWGVAYTEEDLPQPSIEEYVAFLAGKLAAGCQKLGLPLPYLQLEPGRSLAARAGVAVYRVGAVKHTVRRRWLLLDGGMADNPRPALYKARYSALPVLDVERPSRGRAWLAGPYCESGDILIKNLLMPDIQVGELIAVPVSGAYQLSMGSNYNGARKPAVIWLDGAGARLILRRETLEDLINRDEEACI